MQEFCIYVIHNIVNNKVYVGKTNDPKKRWRKHVEAALV
jgi:predicted GIY-YIG superfamily endonuclease